MMERELVAKFLLVDVAVFSLIFLSVSLIVTALRRRRCGVNEEERSPFTWIDLVLVGVLLFFFISNPFLALTQAQAAAEAPVIEQQAPQPDPHQHAGGGALLKGVITIGYFSLVGAIFVLSIKWVRGFSLQELFGLRKMRLDEIVLTVIVVTVAAYFACSVAAGSAVHWWIGETIDRLEEQQAVAQLREKQSLMTLIFQIVAACVLAPLVEEFVFRGYAYAVLKRYTNGFISAAFIALAFAVAHQNFPAALPLIVLSLILTVTYEWTRCLWVCVGVHALFNGITIVGLLVR